MNVPESDEPDRGGRSGERDGTDAAFAEIVAELRAESDVPRWPGPVAGSDPPEPDSEPARGESDGGDEGRPGDEDHYQPPEPPPLPVLRARTVAGLVVLALAALLLIAPGLLGLLVSTSRLLGILALAGGIGWLLWGLRSGPPADSGWDDGARL